MFPRQLAPGRLFEDDPVVALVEERRRRVAKWNAEIDAADDAAAAVGDRSDDRFYSQIGRLDDQIAGMVATSASGVIAQVRILREIESGTFNTDRASDCTDEVFSSIVAGIERLVDRCGHRAACRNRAPWPHAGYISRQIWHLDQAETQQTSKFVPGMPAEALDTDV